MYKLFSRMLLGILILFVGCIRSIYPIYTEQDIVFEPKLIGQWSEGDSKELWSFSKDKANSYTLVFIDDKGKQGKFSVHLAKIKNKLFLDLFPVVPERDENENSFYRLHLIPVHTFIYVKQIEPTLQISFPNKRWFERYITQIPNAIRHEKIDSEIILTASTKDLQAFFLKHLETDGAFDDPINMTKSKLSASEPNKSPQELQRAT